MPTPTRPATRWLADWTRGDPEALSQLLPLVYDELRGLAAHYLRRERPDHTLQPTALVHEAYLRLIDQRNVRWQDRAHFFSAAANVMRRILVEHARQRKATKRQGDGLRLTLDRALGCLEARGLDLIRLDDALVGLAAHDPRQGRIIELRFFGGLTLEEIAEVLGVSLSTVNREWRMARAWLYQQLRMKGEDGKSL